MVRTFTDDYTVLAVERMDNVDRIEELLGVSNAPFPTFTDRQREGDAAATARGEEARRRRGRAGQHDRRARGLGPAIGQ